MKYLKLYENYFDDAAKIEKECDDIGFSMKTKNKEYDNLINSYHILIGEIFDDLSEIEGDYKKVELNFYNKELGTTLEKLIKFGVGYELKLVTDKDTITLINEYQNIKLLGAILDALKEKYPEYFEGKGMGFFDLKTKE